MEQGTRKEFGRPNNEFSLGHGEFESFLGTSGLKCRSGARGGGAGDVEGVWEGPPGSVRDELRRALAVPFYKHSPKYHCMSPNLQWLEFKDVLEWSKGSKALLF